MPASNALCLKSVNLAWVMAGSTTGEKFQEFQRCSYNIQLRVLPIVDHSNLVVNNSELARNNLSFTTITCTTTFKKFLVVDMHSHHFENVAIFLLHVLGCNRVHPSLYICLWIHNQPKFQVHQLNHTNMSNWVVELQVDNYINAANQLCCDYWLQY